MRLVVCKTWFYLFILNLDCKETTELNSVSEQTSRVCVHCTDEKLYNTAVGYSCTTAAFKIVLLAKLAGDAIAASLNTSKSLNDVSLGPLLKTHMICWQWRQKPFLHNSTPVNFFVPFVRLN